MKNSLKLTMIVLGMFLGNMGLTGIVHAQTATIPISTCQGLQNINQNLAGNYVLTQNIDCSNFTFVPLANNGTPFSGSLSGLSSDGQTAFQIQNLTIINPNGSAALFGEVGGSSPQQTSFIQDLVFTNMNIQSSGGSYAAALALQTMGNSVISNVSIHGIIGTTSSSDPDSTISGLVYQVGSQTITNDVIENVEVNMQSQGDATSVISGFATFNYGTIKGCSSEVNIKTQNQAVGFVSSNGGTISNSYSTGTINAIGAGVGFVNANVIGSISNSYAAVNIVGGTSFGVVKSSGFVSVQKIGIAQGTTTNSFWDLDVSGQSYSAAGTGEHTAQMFQNSTYTGWDFTNTWSQYPHFKKMPLVSAVVISSGTPSGTVGFTTSLAISVTTNQNATCKYLDSTTPPGPPPGPSYASMPNTFATTGGTIHTQGMSAVGLAGTTQYFFVNCQSQTGNTAANDYVITFLVSAPAAPTVPANLMASNSTGQIVLSWTASTDTTNVPIAYQVYRATETNGTVGTYTMIGTTGSITYTDTSATPGNTYSYYVRAIVTLPPAPTSSPSYTVTASTTSTISADGSTITPASNEGLVTSAGTWTFGPLLTSAGNEILLNGSSAAGGSAVLLLVYNHGQLYADSKLGSWYQWNGSGWSAVSGDPRPAAAPSVPTGLVGTVVSSSQVNLTWNASTGTITGYKIYRSGTQVGTSTSISYSDTGLTAKTTYSYTVAAYNSSNASAQSTAVNVTTSAAPGISPDGSIIKPGVTASLITSAGTWTFSSVVGGGGNDILLNGSSAAGGTGVLMLVYNSGKLYTESNTHVWWLWNGAGWSSVSSDPDPNGPA